MDAAIRVNHQIKVSYKSQSPKAKLLTTQNHSHAHSNTIILFDTQTFSMLSVITVSNDAKPSAKN